MKRINTKCVLIVSLASIFPNGFSESSVSISESILLDFRTGPYLAWLGIYFTVEDIQDASRTSLSVDPDGDRNSNGFEFLLNSDPLNRESGLKFQRLGEAINRIKVGPVGEDNNIRIQFSSDLKSWAEFTKAELSIDSGYIEFSLEELDPLLFYRVVAGEARE